MRRAGPGYLTGVDLTDCAVLVNGGAAGIGAAVAADFGEHGARVVVADLAAADITADLSRQGSAARVVAEAAERLGGLDVLVNNAGGYASPTYPANDNWRAPLELNLLAVMEGMRHALPWLARRPGIVAWQERFTGVVMVVLGIRLLLGDARPARG